MTESIENLNKIYFKVRFGFENWSSLSSWAIEQLIQNQDGDDKNIILLASSSYEDEADELTEKILSTYLNPTERNDEYLAGKYVSELYSIFYKNGINISALSEILDKIYCALAYPNWLVMLSRNCEYATDVEAFEKPFHEEFQYISHLWQSCENTHDFLLRYDRSVSNTHDV
jgi:hypothetical protein